MKKKIKDLEERWNDKTQQLEGFGPRYRVGRSGHFYFYDRKLCDWIRLPEYRGKERVAVKLEHVWICSAGIVASDFIPNPHHYGTVGYKDGNPYNLCVDNLYWTTPDIEREKQEKHEQGVKTGCNEQGID